MRIFRNNSKTGPRFLTSRYKADRHSAKSSETITSAEHEEWHNMASRRSRAGCCRLQSDIGRWPPSGQGQHDVVYHDADMCSTIKVWPPSGQGQHVVVYYGAAMCSTIKVWPPSGQGQHDVVYHDAAMCSTIKM